MVEVLENLEKAVLEYDKVSAENWARKAIEEGIDPVKASDRLTKAIRQIGDGYSRGELWLPDLVGAASAMKSAMSIVNEQIKKQGKSQKSLGCVVIGTVLGDIHDIGKSMVATLLLADGFEVIDLGVDVNAETFVTAVKEHNANMLAMSALLTTTAHEQGKVIKELEEVGIRNKVAIMVGGAAISQIFAQEIGADGYAPTAPEAVKLAEKLMKQYGRV